MSEHIQAVVKGSTEVGWTIRFIGTTSECYAYMRTHRYGRDWNDLCYTRPDPDKPGQVLLGRMSSWVLE